MDHNQVCEGVKERVDAAGFITHNWSVKDTKANFGYVSIRFFFNCPCGNVIEENINYSMTNDFIGYAPKEYVKAEIEHLARFTIAELRKHMEGDGI